MAAKTSFPVSLATGIERYGSQEGVVAERSDKDSTLDTANTVFRPTRKVARTMRVCMAHVGPVSHVGESAA